MNTLSELAAENVRTGVMYRAVWRWHFYAGLFVAPFAIFLAITGALYLWKPQFEEWRYRDIFNVPVPSSEASQVSADLQFAAAKAFHPGWRATLFTPSQQPGRAAEFVLDDRAGTKTSVFVNPYTGKVVGEIDDRTRPMRIIHDLHGTLLAGTAGEILVELAASWAFVLVVTGFYLWWPRPFSVRGFLLPRFGVGRRALLRDMHAVPAVWLSAFTLVLLATGIPWTRVGGQWIKQLAQTVGEWQPKETNASAHRSEVLGGWSPYLKDKALAEKLTKVASDPTSSTASLPLDAVIAIAGQSHLKASYGIALPQGERGVYSILTDRNRAFERAYIHIDQYSGKILADVRYSQFGFIAKFFTFGIILHEGQLFGLVNQIGGTVVAVGVLLLATTGLAMWWSRRPTGQLGAPRVLGNGRLPRAATVIALALAVLLPLMAATLATLMIFDRFLSKRLPWLRPSTL